MNSRYIFKIFVIGVFLSGGIWGSLYAYGDEEPGETSESPEPNVSKNKQRGRSSRAKDFQGTKAEKYIDNRKEKERRERDKSVYKDEDGRRYDVDPD